MPFLPFTGISAVPQIFCSLPVSDMTSSLAPCFIVGMFWPRVPSYPSQGWFILSVHEVSIGQERRFPRPGINCGCEDPTNLQSVPKAWRLLLGSELEKQINRVVLHALLCLHLGRGLCTCLGVEQGCAGAGEGATCPGMVLMPFLGRDPQTRIIFAQHGAQG